MELSLRDNPRYNIWLALGAIVCLYLVINLALPLIPNSLARTYVIQPILWGFLALAMLTFPKYRTVARLSLKSSIIQLALIIGSFQVALYLIGGLFSGFGKSPYSFTPQGIVTNLVFVISMLIGMELSRAWIVNRLGRKHTFTALVIVTLLYTALSIPLRQIINVTLSFESITFFNSTLFPSLSENLLASMLALWAGPLASMSYRGVLQAFWWFVPILPQLPWAILALIGTAVPIAGFVMINKFYTSKIQRRIPRRQQKDSLAAWIVVAIIAVVIIWFSVGLFPLYPTLVASGSMEPTMSTGDILIVSKVQPDTIEPGDVIQFKTLGEYTVIHRVVEIVETGGSKFFITKGDANSKPDTELVIPENVVGKVFITIPKIGWVAIWVKGLFMG